MPRGHQGTGQGVGSSQGTALQYDRVDLRLPSPQRAPDQYLDYMQRLKQARTPTKDPDAEKRYAETLKQMADMTGWERHQSALQPELDTAYDMLSTLRAAGIADPMTSSVPEAQRAQRQVRNVLRMGKMSDQIKERHGEVMNDIAARRGQDDEYSDEYMAAVAQYFENWDPIKQMDEPLPEPQPTVKRPDFNQHKWDGEFWVPYKGMNLNDGQMRKLSAGTLRDPQVELYTRSRMAQWTDEERASYEEMAKTAGFDKVDEYLRYNDMQQVAMFEPGEPMDPLKFLIGNLPDKTVNDSEFGDVTNTWVGYTNSQKRAYAVVAARHNDYRNALVQQGYIQGGDDVSQEELQRRAVEFGLEFMNMQGTKSGRAEDEETELSASGRAEENAMKGYGRMLEDIEYGTREKMQNVGDFFRDGSYGDKSIASETVVFPILHSKNAEGGMRYGVRVTRTRRYQMSGSGDWVTEPLSSIVITPETSEEAIKLYYAKGLEAKGGPKGGFYYGAQIDGISPTGDNRPGAAPAASTGNGLEPAPDHIQFPAEDLADPNLLKDLTGGH